MSISPKVSQTIQFLNSLDPTKESVTWKDNELAKVEKRSAFHNFFSWFIYLITFTLVPRNRELDQITQEILKDLADDIGNATVQEKDLAEKAVRILNEVSANNGGSRGKELDQLLATMDKIQGLPEVQKLAKSPKKEKKEPLEPEAKESPKKPVHKDLKNDKSKDAPETAKTEQSNDIAKVQKLDSDNTTLQRMLQDIIRVVGEKKKKGEEVNTEEELREFWKQLPSQDATVALSEDELKLLKEIFENNPENASKTLSPKLLTCLVKNCLEISDLEILAGCVSQLTLDKKLALALVKGFEKDQKPVKEDVDSKKKEVAGLKVLYRSIVTKIPDFKDDLTADELRGFILCLIENVGKSHAREASGSFYYILDFFDSIPALKKDRMILKALCQVKENEFLVELYALVDVAEIGFVTEEILKIIPSQQNDPDEVNFAEFISKVMDSFSYGSKEDAYRNFLEHVFKNVSTKRQEIVCSKLSPYWIAHCFEVIPAPIFSTLDSSTIRSVAGEVWQQHVDAPNDKRLQAFAKAVTADHLVELVDSGSLTDVCMALLPLMDSQTQIQFVNKVFDAVSDALHEFIEKTQLAPDVYAQASKLNAKRDFRMVHNDYSSPEIWAAIVNGQIGNDEFLREFFDGVFPIYDERNESRVACFAYLEPEAFVFAEPQKIYCSQWYAFFKALREMKDQQQAKTLLISAAVNLFNKLKLKNSCPELYTLTREQMLLLPIDQFNAPEIRLLLAVLSDRLDDGLIATANSLYDSQKGAFFFDLFKAAYDVKPDLTPTDLEEQKLAFIQNKECLKNFLKWVINRPSLLPTWNWINEYLDYTNILLEDADLQILIQKAGLKVNENAKSSWDF